MTQKIKVLHIITQLELGGAQQTALDIVRYLDKSRYDIYFVSSTKGLLVPEARIPGVKTVLLPTLTRPINPFADLATLCRLILLFKKEKIDLVHTHSSKAGILGRWAARLAGVSVIVHTIHGWSFHRHLKPVSKSFYPFLERVTAQFTDKLVAVSGSDIQKGLSNRIATKDKYALIRYGIDRGMFLTNNVDVAKKKRELGLKSQAPVVGMIACFKPQKAPQDFVRVASLVLEKKPRTQFLLVGDGLLRSKIERLIKQLKLKNFILTGWRRDIPEIMSCLDILTLTSLWEGAPLVFLQAMCKRIPIIAYNVDGVSEVIKNGSNGFLIRPGDCYQMASRIDSLLENRGLLRRMGRTGFHQVMNNGSHTERMLAELDRLYSDLTKIN